MKKIFMRYSEKQVVRSAFGFCVLMCIVATLSGCGDFFSQKPTEIQSRAILKELSEVRESPNIQNPLPEVYRQPTERLAIKGGIKVFYFTRHHPAANLAVLVQQQLGVQSTINPATNQIVAYCTNDAQADAVQQYLELVDVTPVQVNVDCLILERFGDITMDWETTLLVENLLGEEITLGESKYPDPVFPGASLRESERSNFGLDFGYWHNQGVDGHQIRAIVDVLISQGYLKILLNPQLETINGQPATVTIKDYAPIEEVKTGSAGASGVYNITKYVWVENTLSVTPHVYSDGSIGLTTSIKIGSRSKPEGVVQRAIITERSINVEENRIAPGKSLIIGGMRKSEKRSVVRGIPFFKDLPLLGILFSSKDFEEKGTEIIFILTPSISSGGVENKEMVEELRGKYEEPQYEKGLTDIIMDPLGRDPFTQVLEREATEAEMGRVQAEVDLELAQMQARAAKERADEAESRAEQLRQQAQQLRQQVTKAQEEAQKIAAETQNTKDQIQAAQQQAAELEAARQKVTAEAQQAQVEAQATKQKATEAAQRVQQAQQQAQQAQEQTEQAQEQLDKTQKSAQENKPPPPAPSDK